MAVTLTAPAEVIVFGEGTDPGMTFRALIDGARLRNGPFGLEASIAHAPGYFLAATPTSHALAMSMAADRLREGEVQPGEPFGAIPVVADKAVEKSSATLYIVLEHGDLLLGSDAVHVVRSRRPGTAEVEILGDESTYDLVTAVSTSKVTGYSVTGSERLFANLADAMEAAVDQADRSPGATIAIDKVSRGVEGPLVSMALEVVRREITARAIAHRVVSTSPLAGFVFFGSVAATVTARDETAAPSPNRMLRF